MKKYFTLFASLLLATLSNAQTASFSFVDPKVQNIAPSCDGFEEYKVHILNEKSDSLALAWIGLSNNLDSCWEMQYSICDNYNCYLGIPTNTIYFNKIGVGDTTNLKFGNSGMTAYSGNPTGRILIWDADATSNIDTITFNVTIDCGAQQCDAIASAHDISGNNNFISLSPNPSADFLNLNLHSAKATSLSIYDLNGRKIISVPVNAEMTKLNIQWLDNGNYFLEVVNNHQTIQTLRFSKI